MDLALKDLRHAVRALFRDPTVTLIAVVALGLGIGLTTVMFSIVYGALHRGLPFDGADRIMHLERANLPEDIESMEVSMHDFVDWKERQTSFESLAAFYQGTVNVRGTERPERYQGGFMTPGSFAILGEEPVMGRTFLEEDGVPGAPFTVILGHDVWQEDFGGDPDILRTTLTVNGEPATVIGVMPEGFEFPILQEVWVPFRMDPGAEPRGEGRTVEVFGKLREGVTPDQAMVELTGIAEQLAQEYPQSNAGVTPIIKPYTEEFVGEEETGILYAMLATVILVLLIACANVANLLLARASVRSRDVAIRTALGASRYRVIVQLLGEALVLAAVGATLGTAIAWVGIELFDRAVAPTDPPFWLVFKLDAPILGFVILISVLAALASGLIPALRASSTDVNSVLKDESRGSSGLHIGRLSRTLVVAEVAMSVALLVASGLMVKSVISVNAVEYGFATEEVFTARVGIFPERFPDVPARRRFWQELETRLAAIPAAEAATVVSHLPGTGSNMSSIQIEGENYQAGQDLPPSRWALVTPTFLETFQLDVIQGRGITPLDDAAAEPVALVNESFVARHFPAGDPLGRRFKLGGLGPENENPWVEIVGVVPDTYLEGVGNPEPETPEGFFMPVAQHDASFMSIAVRTATRPLQLTSDVRDAVVAADPDTPIYWVDTLQGQIDEQTWFFRVFGALFAVFGAAALFMASVGLYGVMSFTVTQRVQEMGIRMALGAEGGRVLRLILGQGMKQIAVGLVLGTGLAVLVANGLQLLLFDSEPWDPPVYAFVFVVLTLTGMAATLVPALRATRIDPIEALRYE